MTPFAVTCEKVTAPAQTFRIWIAGDYDRARQIVRDFCSAQGACFALQRTDYLYSGGEERGVCVVLINYPRFPKTPQELEQRAEKLADTLLAGLGQSSYTIEGPHSMCWVSRRRVNDV